MEPFASLWVNSQRKLILRQAQDSNAARYKKIIKY
jgi:hypothetical protein